MDQNKKGLELNKKVKSRVLHLGVAITSSAQTLTLYLLGPRLTVPSHIPG